MAASRILANERSFVLIFKNAQSFEECQLLPLGLASPDALHDGQGPLCKTLAHCGREAVCWEPGSCLIGSNSNPMLMCWNSIFKSTWGCGLWGTTDVKWGCERGVPTVALMAFTGRQSGPASTLVLAQRARSSATWQCGREGTPTRD